jgi:Putative transmembrane protein (PGPGW)
VRERLERFTEWWRSLPSPWRQIAVATGGAALLVAGAAMLVLPGPGLVVIALAIGLLATEFRWARSVVARGRALYHRVRGS